MGNKALINYLPRCDISLEVANSILPQNQQSVRVIYGREQVARSEYFTKRHTC